MKKTITFILWIFLVVMATSTAVVYAEEIEIWNEVNLTSSFSNQSTGNQYNDVNQSNGWIYHIGSNPYDYQLTSKQILLDVDRITEVQVPQFIITSGNQGIYDTIGATSLRFYHSPLSQTPYKTQLLSTIHDGQVQDYAYLRDPLEVIRGTYVEIRITLMFDIASDIHYSTGRAEGLTPTQAMDRLLYSLRASFRDDLMLNQGTGSNVFLNRTGQLEDKSNYKSVVIGERLTTYTPPSEYNLLSDVLATQNSFFDNASLSQMGQVDFNLKSSNSVDVIINYGQTYVLNYNFSSETDMSMFTDYYEAFYFSDDVGAKYVVINLGSSSMFGPDAVYTFSPHVIWHLNSHEIFKVDRLNIYMHTRLEAANNGYAYFYVDDFVIDHLLSISLRYRYRYVYPWGTSTYGNPVNVILEDGASTAVDPLSWQSKFMFGTAAAITVASFIPGAQLPAVLIGTSILAYISALSSPSQEVNRIQFGSVQQIEKMIYLSPVLEAELEASYREQFPDDNFTQIKENSSVFRLHLGQFNEVFTNGIQFDKEYSEYQYQRGINVVQMTYMSQGQLHTLYGNDLGTNPGYGSGTDEDPIINVPDIDIVMLIALLIGFAVPIVTMLIAFFNGTFADKYKGFKFKIFISTLFGSLIAGIILAVLVYLFMIFIIPLAWSGTS